MGSVILGVTNNKLQTLHVMTCLALALHIFILCHRFVSDIKEHREFAEKKV